MKLKDKVAIVTGAGQGIGKGIALALAKEGAKVVVSDISEKRNDVVKEVVVSDISEKRNDVVKEIQNSGGEAIAVKADVSNSEETGEMAKATIEKFGKIDILVNNAGIYPLKPLIEMTEEDWDKVLNINLKGTFNCTKAVLSKMVEQKSGNIINIML